jgi:hypothetical protein
VALADALAMNSSIETVQLYGNKNVRSTRIAAIANMVEVNHTLIRFDAPVTEDRENRIKIEVTLRSRRKEIARSA